MARSTLPVIVAALAAALVAPPADAQWKWRDKGGRVQYSDLPPPSGTAEADILSRPAGAQRRGQMAPVPVAPEAAASAVAGASAPALQPRVVDAELEAKRKKTEQDQAAKNKELERQLAVAKADNCQRAKSNLATLDSGIRMARVNQKGEREFLDDAQRASERKRTQDLIAADCK